MESVKEKLEKLDSAPEALALLLLYMAFKEMAKGEHKELLKAIETVGKMIDAYCNEKCRCVEISE